MCCRWTSPRFALLVSALFCSASVEAWWSPGHLVIGEITAETLKSNAVKTNKYDPGPVILDRALSVLQSYSTYYPVETRGLSESSVWLDDIKNAVKAFSHWHYIDGMVQDEMTLPVDQISPLDTTQIYNATWALISTNTTLTNPSSSAWDQTFFLFVLTHILGDIHQPLHCATRFTSSTPSGDRGGNSVSITFTKDAQEALKDGAFIHNLHSLWDNALGALDDAPEIYPRPKGSTGVDPQAVKEEAARLMKLHPLNKFASDPSFFDFSSGKIEDLYSAWADECQVLAAKYVYTTVNGTVLVSNSSEAIIDKAYVDRGRGVAEEQLAKAGYRLAYVLSYVYSINKHPATIRVVNITTVKIHSDSDDNQVIVGVLATVIVLMGAAIVFLIYRLKTTKRRTELLHRFRSSRNDEKAVDEHLNT